MNNLIIQKLSIVSWRYGSIIELRQMWACWWFIYQTHMLFIVMNIGLTQPTSIHCMDRCQKWISQMVMSLILRLEMQVGLACVEFHSLIWLNAVLNKVVIKTIFRSDMKRLNDTCSQNWICSSTCHGVRYYWAPRWIEQMFVWPYPNEIKMNLNSLGNLVQYLDRET